MWQAHTPGMRRAVPWLVPLLLMAGCGGGSSGSDDGVAEATPTPRPARTITIEEIERLARQRARRATPTPSPAPAGPSRPPMTDSLIPFPESRKQEMAAYARRHYGLDTHRLVDPRVIVQHYTVTDDAASAVAIFAPDRPDPEHGELPNVCAHFVVDRDGTILRVVPLSIMCRHTIGLNHTAIGIEHAGFSAEEVLGNPAQMRASLALTRWLRCRYGIDPADVIGHNESLSSPYHLERVASWRDRTHEDFTAAEMEEYRARLSRGSGSGGC